MEQKQTVKRKVKVFEKYLMLILIATLFMSVAYAETTDILLTVTGTVTTDVQDGVFISDINVASNEGMISQEIKYYGGTTLSSTIKLSSTSSSYLTYAVSLRNNSATDYYFTGTKYDEYGYDNSNIDFELDIEPYLAKILANGDLNFNIKFKYKDGVSLQASQILNSLLIFEFNNEFINFTINGNNYTAPKGITWEQFIGSDYDSYNELIINNGKVYNNRENALLLLTELDVNAKDEISDGGNYVLECKHKYTSAGDDYSYMGDGTHSKEIYCDDCSEFLRTDYEECSDSNYDALCDMCGGYFYEEWYPS